MSDCVYVYDPQNKVSKKEQLTTVGLGLPFQYSIETLLMNEEVRKAYENKKATTMVFYHSGSTKNDAVSKLEQLSKKSNTLLGAKGSKSVTTIIKDSIEQRKHVKYGNTRDKVEDLKANFYKEYGTLIHACLASKNKSVPSSKIVSKSSGTYTDNLRKLQDLLENTQQELEKLRVEAASKGEFSDFVFDAINEIPADVAELKVKMDALYNDLGLNNYTVGQDLFFEIPVSFEYSGVTYTGVIDCITIDKDGNVNIIDFKSTQKIHSSTIGDDVKKSYLLQLKLYETILKQCGIQGKITSEIKPIIAKGKNMDILKGNVLSTKKSDYYNSNNQLYLDIMKIVDLYLPHTHKKLTTPEEQAVQKDIEKGLHKVFRADYLNKEDPSVFKEFIINKYVGKSKVYKSITLDKFVYLEQDGDSIIVKDADTGSILKQEDFITFVKEELEERRENRTIIFNDIQEAFENKDKDALTSLLGRDSTLTGARIEHVQKYLAKEWKLVRAPLTDNNFILVFQNVMTGDVDLVSVVQNINLDYTYTFQDEDSNSHNRQLLGDVLRKKDLARFKNNQMHSSISNINAFKAVAIFNAVKHTLPIDQNTAKLGQVMCLSDVNGDARVYGKEVHDIVDQLKVLAVAKKEGMIEGDDTDILFKGVENLNITSRTDYLISEVFSALNIAGFSSSEFNDFDKYVLKGDEPIHVKIEKLKELQAKIRQEYSEFFLEDRTKTRTGVTNDIQYLDDVLSKAIYMLSNNVSLERLSDVSSTGLDFNNSIRLAKQLYTDNFSGITSEGVSLTGFFQGIDFASPYSNPSEAVRQVSQWHSYSVTLIQRELDDYVDGQNKAFAKWITSKKSLISAKLTKADSEIFLNTLIKKNPDGSFDQNFRFKNPFDMSEDLTDEDREYLKYCIWDIMRIRQYVKEGSLLNDEKVKKMNYIELSKNPSYVAEFKSLLNNPHNLNVPLRKASDTKLFTKGFTSVLKGDFADAKDYYKSILGKWKSVVDDRGITSEQEKQKKEQMSRLKAFNMYNEDIESREKRLEGQRIDNFECNINYLVIDHAYNYVTCKVNQQVLNNTDRLLSVIAALERQTGKDFSKHREAIIKRTAISMYNTNNIENDYKDFVGTIGILRKMLNFSAIALRPALFFKEMVVGRVKNHTSAALGYFANEGITYKDLARAEQIVFGEGLGREVLNKFNNTSIEHREKVEQINHMYRIANRDSNVMSHKSSASKNDIFGADADLMYYANTRPDWFNRLSIMVAKMIADGSWDAHKMVDGKLVYDATQDARYSTYFKYKDNPPKKGSSDYETYKEQEARYFWSLNEFQKQGFTNAEGEPLKKGDPLPMGYTDKEVNSMKEIIGLLYGYFNHEEKNIFQSETFSALFMAFKTYWNAEWRYYFGTPNKNTSRGKLEYVRDAEGNILYSQEDENLGISFTTTKASYINSKGEEVENTAIVDFTGTPTEGIAISFTKCLFDLFTPEGRERLKANPTQRKQAYIFLIRMLYWLLVGNLLAFMVSGSDNDAYAVQKTVAIAEKSASDLFFVDSLSIGDIPLVGVEKLQQLARGAFNSVTDDDGYDPTSFFSRIGAINDFLPA